jgi:membrane protease YdiL (CAAX protease family)
MDNDDILRIEDVSDARAEVLKTRRRVLGAAVVTPILSAALVWLLVYYLKTHNAAASTFVAAIFLLLGVPVFVHWWRHYRSILRQLDLVAQRVANGETIYGSKVPFHSYQ